ncbi:hypothetical protein PINS_up003563 [Pythium insidiosum]|nr:hypothetical protein PINS_up003563 [Pythium insidiosum]
MPMVASAEMAMEAAAYVIKDAPACATSTSHAEQSQAAVRTGDGTHGEAGAAPKASPQTATEDANLVAQSTPATPSRGRHPKRSRHAIAAGIHSKKKKRKKQAVTAAQVTESHPCLDLYVDAMDSKRMWAEARIIDCDPEEERIKITFIGWPKKWDMWTDQLSIRAHGSIVPLKKGPHGKSWNGNALFGTDASLTTITDPPRAPIRMLNLSKNAPYGAVEVLDEHQPAEMNPRVGDLVRVERKVVAKPVKSLVKVPEKDVSKQIKSQEKRDRVSDAGDRKKASKRSITSTSAPKRLAVRMSKSVPSPPPSSTWSRVLRQEKRVEVQGEMNTAKAFLEQCADVWRQQFFSSRCLPDQDKSLGAVDTVI